MTCSTPIKLTRTLNSQIFRGYNMGLLKIYNGGIYAHALISLRMFNSQFLRGYNMGLLKFVMAEIMRMRKILTLITFFFLPYIIAEVYALGRSSASEEIFCVLVLPFVWYVTIIRNLNFVIPHFNLVPRASYLFYIGKEALGTRLSALMTSILLIVGHMTSQPRS